MSAMPDVRARLAAQVIQGADGYLFHRDHEAVEQLTGAAPFTAAELSVWQNAVETRAAWCRANGIAFRMMIIPEKHVVYADRLPPEYAASPNRPAIQLLDSLDPATRALCHYPLTLLRDARATRETYLQTDTHWTFYAGFLAYRALVDDLARTLDLPTRVGEDDLTFTARPYVGDLGVRLDPEPEESMAVIAHARSWPFTRTFENKVFARGALSIYETPNAELPRCILFRDSFANYIIPHLIPTFSRLITVSSDSMHYDLVRSERPDVVIFAIIERFLGMSGPDGQRRLPEDLTAPPMGDVSGLDVATIRGHTTRPAA